MDTSTVGVVAAELMDQIGDDCDDDVQVGTVAVVVGLIYPPSVSEEDGSTCIRYRCTDARAWIQAGLFDQAARAAHG